MATKQHANPTGSRDNGSNKKQRVSGVDHGTTSILATLESNNNDVGNEAAGFIPPGGHATCTTTSKVASLGRTSSFETWCTKKEVTKEKCDSRNDIKMQYYMMVRMFSDIFVESLPMIVCLYIFLLPLFVASTISWVTMKKKYPIKLL